MTHPAMQAYPEKSFVPSYIEVPVERRVALYREAVSDIPANTASGTRTILKERLRAQFDVTVADVERYRFASLASVGSDVPDTSETCDTLVCPIHRTVYLLDSGDRNLDCRQCLEETHRMMDAALASGVAREQRTRSSPLVSAPVAPLRRLDGSAVVSLVGATLSLLGALLTFYFHPPRQGVAPVVHSSDHAWKIHLTGVAGRR